MVCLSVGLCMPMSFSTCGYGITRENVRVHDIHRKLKIVGNLFVQQCTHMHDKNFNTHPQMLLTTLTVKENQNSEL